MVFLSLIIRIINNIIMLIILISRKKKKYQNLNRYEVEKSLYSSLKGGWSRRQSCDPVWSKEKRERSCPMV